jgi:hypothetical protein
MGVRPGVGGVDDVLYELCREQPGRSDRRAATAKLALIGRAYSARLERRVTPPKGPARDCLLAWTTGSRAISK